MPACLPACLGALCSLPYAYAARPDTPWGSTLCPIFQCVQSFLSWRTPPKWSLHHSHCTTCLVSLFSIPACVHVPPSCQSANAKHAMMDLRLYLEVPWPPSIPEQQPLRTEINLFFKFYDWQVSWQQHRRPLHTPSWPWSQRVTCGVTWAQHVNWYVFL
mgnify:CR=1 FL=1